MYVVGWAKNPQAFFSTELPELFLPGRRLEENIAGNLFRSKGKD